MKIGERVCYKNAPQSIKNELAIRYEPLMRKLTNQYILTNKTRLNYDDIYSMAEEGFVDAINMFDPKISEMDFTKFAAYAIRNKILLCITRQENAVTLNHYGLNQQKKKTGNYHITTKIDPYIYDEEDKNKNNELKLNWYEEPKSIQNPFPELYKTLQRKFSKDELYLFYSFYGLNGYEKKTATDLSKELKQSVCVVSLKTRKIINYIKQNKILTTLLEDLL